MLNMSTMVPFWLSISCNIACGLTPGTGMKLPMRYTIRANNTNNSRWRSSVNFPSPPRAPAAVLACAKVLLHAAAGGFDRCLGTGSREHALEHELLGQVALLDDLGLLGSRRHQLGSAQRGEVDVGDVQLLELVGQHFGGVELELRTEANLRHALLHRHLAAFEASLDLALAGARERTLVGAAGSPAQARTNAATDALALGAGAVSGTQSIQFHDYFP